MAVVGRAAYLAHKEQGEFIDSHDVVVRIHCNKPSPYGQPDMDTLWYDDARKLVGGMGVPPGEWSFIPDNFHKYIGTKTDVFVPSWFHLTTHGLDVFYSRLAGLGVKYVIHPKDNVRKDDGETLRAVEYDEETVKCMEYVDSHYLPVHICEIASHQETYKRCDFTFPMPGTVLIYDLLKMEPRSLYVTGCPCYLDDPVLLRQSDLALEERLSGGMPMPYQYRLNMMALRNLAHEFQYFDVDSEMKELSANMWLDSRFPGE